VLVQVAVPTKLSRRAKKLLGELAAELSPAPAVDARPTDPPEPS